MIGRTELGGVLNDGLAKARAKQAMARARAIWPGAHGEVLCDEIKAGYTLRWLGPNARILRLIDDILATPEAPR